MHKRSIKVNIFYNSFVVSTYMYLTLKLFPLIAFEYTQNYHSIQKSVSSRLARVTEIYANLADMIRLFRELVLIAMANSLKIMTGRRYNYSFMSSYIC